MEELLKLKIWLAEAEMALHRLMTGEAAVSLQENERKITFTAAKAPDLRSYIDDLKQRICALEGNCPPRRGPVVFTF